MSPFQSDMFKRFLKVKVIWWVGFTCFSLFVLSAEIVFFNLFLGLEWHFHGMFFFFGGGGRGQFWGGCLISTALKLLKPTNSTTLKVDGETRMYWFIMAPYTKPPFWELHHLLSPWRIPKSPTSSQKWSPMFSDDGWWNTEISEDGSFQKINNTSKKVTISKGKFTFLTIDFQGICSVLVSNCPGMPWKSYPPFI